MIKSVFLKEVIILLIFSLIISISQSLVLKPHLNFGFAPDDVTLISTYISLGPSPFSKFNTVWRENGGPRFVNPLYYNGILYSAFGFDYRSYQVAALIFKILAIISLYLLIQTVFKNYLLSFTAGIIFSLHYGSVGSMEMVARTQDYLVIVGLNIFLIIFYFIETGRLKNIFWKFFASIILFSGFFINPIRAYPILPFIFSIEVASFIKNMTKNNLYSSSKNLAIYLLPFILFFLFVNGSSGPKLGNFQQTIQETLMGNWQLLLTPITTLGSYFLVGDGLRLLGLSNLSMSMYLDYVFLGTSIFFGVITLILSFFLSKKKLKFFLSIFVTNFLLELVFFLIFNRGLGTVLPADVQVHYDISNIPPTILGLYIFILTFFIFLEWRKNKENAFYILYLISIVFAITFIVFTWIFGHYGYIALGINGYSTIPSMGISGALAAVLVLIYTKIKIYKNSFKYFAPAAFLVLLPYLSFSNSQIQDYLQRNIKQGNNASDQIRLRDKFWSFIKDPQSCNKFFFLDTKGDYDNGYFYSFIVIDRFDQWYSLYGPYHSKQNCPVGSIVSDESKLKNSFTYKNGIPGFLYKNSVSEEKFSGLDYFYALRFKNRDIVDIRQEILQELE